MKLFAAIVLLTLVGIAFLSIDIDKEEISQEIITSVEEHIQNELPTEVLPVVKTQPLPIQNQIQELPTIQSETIQTFQKREYALRYIEFLKSNMDITKLELQEQGDRWAVVFKYESDEERTLLITQIEKYTGITIL